MTTTLQPGSGSASSFGTDPGDPLAARTIGGPGEHLTSEQVRTFVDEALATVDLDGRSVCLVVPDGTRTCPLPLLLQTVHAALDDRARVVTVVIALGTHQGSRSWPTAAR